MNLVGTLAKSSSQKEQIEQSSNNRNIFQKKGAYGSEKSPFISKCGSCQSRVLQAKLMVGSNDDPLEHEADRVADQVMTISPNIGVNSSPPRIQRFGGQATEDAPASVDRVLSSQGRPLEPKLRENMERRFGYDFTRVRVHDGAEAERSALDINAHAYTSGHHIVFRDGQYVPHTTRGMQLLAHELTHVIQQKSQRLTQPIIQRQFELACEKEKQPGVSVEVRGGKCRYTMSGPSTMIWQMAFAAGFKSDFDIINKTFRKTVCYDRKRTFDQHIKRGFYFEVEDGEIVAFGGIASSDKSKNKCTIPKAVKKESNNQESKKKVAEKPNGNISSAEFLSEQWKNVNELGLVYKEGPLGRGGANMRETPDGKLLSWLPQNTRVFIIKHHPKRHWYAVATMGRSGGGFGYIADWLLVRGLPDPDAEVLKIKQGNTPIEISKHFYSAKGFNVWSKDARYVVNALVYVNRNAKHNFPGKSGLNKVNVSDAWFTAKATSGTYIWMPGTKYLNKIYEQVVKHGGTGSISANAWRGVKKLSEYAAYGIAFVAGLVFGFAKSLWDAVAGLAKMIVDVLVSIFTGNVLKDAKNLWEAVSKMTWKDIKNAVSAWAEKWEKKLNSHDPWTAGHAHGYLTGYIMAEAAQLLITGGTLTAAKGALWGSRLGKVIKASRGFKALVTGVKKLSGPASKARRLMGEAREALKATKVFTTFNAARKWAMGTFKLSAKFVKDLSLEAINRLGRLPEAVRKRISKLSEAAKRFLFGCSSPCKCNTDAIRKMLDTMTDEDIERALAPLSAAAKASKQEVTDAIKRGKIAKSGKAAKVVTTLHAIPVEDVVQEAMSILKAQGIKGLHPSQYGTKLAKAVNDVLVKRLGAIPSGWIVGAEKRLGKVIKLRPANAKLTVQEYMIKWGMANRYPKFSKKFLGTRIEDLKPDLFVRAPNGRALVWDVTSQPEIRHIAKTMFYSEVIYRELGGKIFRISESYWKKLF